MKKHYEAHVWRLCRELRSAYFTGEYSMDINFEYEECEADRHRIADGKVTVAEIDVDPTYLTITITIYAHLYEHFKKGHSFFVVSMLAHEFAHILTEPLFRLAKQSMNPQNEKEIIQTNERQTQRIANILVNRLPRKFWAIKKPVKKKKKKSRH